VAAELEAGVEPLKCSEFFALENMSLARDTPLERRFFSVVGVVLLLASLLLRSVDVVPLPVALAAGVPSVGAGPVAGAGAVAGFELSLVA
jgi:hypothetical protein